LESFEKRTLPVIDHGGVHFKFGRRFGDGFFIPDGGKCHFGLKFSTLRFSFFAHGQLLSYVDPELSTLSSFWGSPPIKGERKK
jgi:hypothetical protein